MAGRIPRSLACVFSCRPQSSWPSPLPSGTEEPKRDIAGTKLLAEVGGQEALWLGELWVYVCLRAFHRLSSHS